MGASGFSLLFHCFSSVVVVEWGGEFIVPLMKNEGFAFGSLRQFQENNDDKVGFGRCMMGSQYH